MADPSSRRICLQALRRWDASSAYASDILDDLFKRHPLPREDRALAQSLVYGVLRNRRLLDAWMALFRQEGTFDDEARRILQSGLYQAGFMRVPDHAVVNETVSLAPGRLRGLVNAILRRALRERDRFEILKREVSKPVLYSLPDFLYAKWEEQFGEEITEALAQWNQEPAPNYVRPNALASAPEEFSPEAVGLQPSREHPGFFRVTGILPEPFLAAGQAYVQDPSTVVACDLLDPRPGEIVLDACAAPGGKTAILAERMENRGELLACDVGESRLARLRENLRRLHVICARVVERDWLDDQESPFPEVDRILMDLPCSNTGVLRRRVDLRWRLKPETFDEMASLQRRIAEAALAFLRPGGRAVYSTCSIEPEENRGVVERLLAEDPTLALVEIRERFPWRHSCDGAFAALLEKRP